MARPLNFDGAFTVIATPFLRGEVDFAALDKLLEHQIAGGIHGVVPVGTTGESPTLSPSEQQAVIERTVVKVDRRAFVIAGTGTNATRETIERTREATKAGVDAAMIVMPYYNKPTQRGLVEHVRAIHDATDIPLVLYNVPPRTITDLSVEATAEILKSCPRVVAIKEATGNVVRTQQLVAAHGTRLAVLSGDDALTLGILACGGRGVISVTSNVAPALVQDIVTRFHRGDLEGAREQHFALLGLHDSMFVETNPGPLKAALSMMGICAPELRLPMAWPAEKSLATIRGVLQTYKLI